MPTAAQDRLVPEPGSAMNATAQRGVYGRRLRSWLQRRPAQMFVDAACGFVAVTLAYGLRFDLQMPGWARTDMWLWAATLCVLDPVFIYGFNKGHSTWRHFGLGDLGFLVRRVALLHGALLVFSLFVKGPHRMPAGIVLLDFVLVVCICVGVRLLQRLEHERSIRVPNEHRILLAATAETIAEAIRQLQPFYGDGLSGALVEGGSMTHQRILGVPVLGGTEAISGCLNAQGIDLLLLCSADLKNLAGMIEEADKLKVTIKFLPSLHDLLNNKVHVSKPVTVLALRKGQENHCQGREEILELLRDKVVLVTGAGGSIGAEIVRQVAAAPIRKLVLLDQDENALFELMGQIDTRSDLQPVIADIRDREALREVFARESPQVVLHAAAYKHVPLMEANPSEAVLNNVYGTRLLAETALAFRAERMVMISSDKAVRPSGVMGATKRLAEIVIQEIAARANDEGDARTEFACVRFGNVLGSRGSVLPIFLQQVQQGGPVTVTHEEMTRYFMTIPQAVHLVLQAATLGSRGNIYMLEMGDPVRIMSLAREVIQLAGLTPGKDIDIQLVGSRPGEKLREQPWEQGAHVIPTRFEHVFEVFAGGLPTGVCDLLPKLERAAKEHRSETVRELLQYLQIDKSEPEVRTEASSQSLPLLPTSP